MLTAEFDYQLPDESIAQNPAPRGQSRLLRLPREGHCTHHRVHDLPTLLRPGDLLVVNDTQVIPARLHAHRRVTGGRLELLLVESLSPTEWMALARPGRRARPATRLELDDNLSVEILEKLDEGRVRIRFSERIEPHLGRLGHVPLPPYIRRQDRDTDRDDYQTVFAARPGAIAAPTAGLHFSRALLAEIENAGIGLATITLHVGIGTFKPVSTERIENHQMDSERFEVPDATVSAISETRSAGGRIVAVGTTVVRALESAITAAGEFQATSGKTDLFIRSGHPFRAIDLLLTNFHLPRSTLLMLVCAFAGRQRVLDAYNLAIARGYRFYSYGDCMLLERRESDPTLTPSAALASESSPSESLEP